MYGLRGFKAQRFITWLELANMFDEKTRSRTVRRNPDAWAPVKAGFTIYPTDCSD